MIYIIYFLLNGVYTVLGLPLPQGGGAAGAHGQPQAGSPSTPGPGGPGSPVGPGSAGGAIASLGPVRRGRGWWDWHRRDPTLFKGLWASREPKGPLGEPKVPILVLRSSHGLFIFGQFCMFVVIFVAN